MIHDPSAFLALAAFFALAAPLGRADEANHVSAPISAVRVIDGDTLAVNGRVIRLSGIDAPEIGQTCDHNGHPWSCGMTAALDLRKSLTMSRLSGLYCRIERKARYWEEATCSVSDWDLAESLLRQGAADRYRWSSPITSASWTGRKRQTRHLGRRPRNAQGLDKAHSAEVIPNIASSRASRAKPVSGLSRP